MSASSVSRSLGLGRARLVQQTVEGTRAGRLPFIFQHGMGGDADQPLGYTSPYAAPRRPQQPPCSDSSPRRGPQRIP
jgi:hypothetical protein